MKRIQAHEEEMIDDEIPVSRRESGEEEQKAREHGAGADGQQDSGSFGGQRF